MNGYQELKNYLTVEVIGKNSDKGFSWFKLAHRLIKCPERRFYFWWRYANYLYSKGSLIPKAYAKRINRRLVRKYNTEIMLGTKIQPGLCIPHFTGGIVVSDKCIIGKNFKIRQNTTIGIHHSGQAGCITIGDNVTLGAHCCIVGENIDIGDNVIVGAMSFINKNIPDNCTYYTIKTNKIIVKRLDINPST